MPILSRMGRALMGVGSAIISVDGRVVPEVFGGWGGWLDDDTIVVQDLTRPDPQVLAVTVDTGAQRVLANRGANRIVAGDGQWAVWSSDIGYQDSFGRRKPEGAPVSGDWYPIDCYDGQIIIQPIYHGPPTRHAWNGHRVSSDVPTKWPYACGHVEGYGLCVWPVGERTRGIVLSNDGHDFHPDLCVRADGTLMVASSVGAGELPHELRTYVIDETQNRVWYRARPQDPQLGWSIVRADLTRPASHPDEPVQAIPTFRPATHPIRVEVFGAPGFNLSLGDPRHDDFQTPPWGVFCTMERDDTDAVQRWAETLGVPLFAYTDSDTFDSAEAERLTEQSIKSVIGTVQFYPSGDHQRILDSIGRAQHTTDSVAIVAAAYRQIRGDGTYAWTVSQVLARLSLAWERARVDPTITHFLIFHQNRANGRDGVVSRSEFMEAVSRIRAAAAAYQPPVAPPTPPPVVTPPPVPPVVSPPVVVPPVVVPPSPSVPLVPVPPMESALLQEITQMSTTEKELFRGLLRHDQLLSVEPASHNAQSEDIVRWHTRPHVIGAWEQVRVHAPDPETPELLAVDFVAAGKRLAIDEDGQMHLNPLTAWGRYEAFRGGQWADGQEFVIRRADVSRGGVTFTLVTV